MSHYFASEVSLSSLSKVTIKELEPEPIGRCACGAHAYLLVWVVFPPRPRGFS